MFRALKLTLNLAPSSLLNLRLYQAEGDVMSLLMSKETARPDASSNARGASLSNRETLIMARKAHMRDRHTPVMQMVATGVGRETSIESEQWYCQEGK